MDMSFWILVGMLVVAVAIALWRGGLGLIVTGLKQAWLTFKSVWVQILLGFTLGGMINVLVPSSLIAEWLGPASGMKGILIASYVGIIIAGGPYVTLPVIASIYEAGAGPGPVIALLTSSILGLQNLIVWSIPFVGVKIALIRYAICLLVPPLAGLVGSYIFQLISAG